MTGKEFENQTPPQLLYESKLKKFAARKEAILHPPPSSLLRVTLWEKIGIRKPKPTAPVFPPLQEQLAVLDQEFHSWLHADRQMVVCHLKANPTTQEEVVKRYCQSPELLNDPETLSRFFEFWLLEFFQKTDTGEVENLFPFISSAEIKRLPRELQQAKKNIFDPLLKQLDADALNQIKENLRRFGISSASQNLARAFVICKLPLPKSLIEEYQKYVGQLAKLEAGIVPIEKNEPELPQPKTARREKIFPESALPPQQVKPQPETPPAKEVEYSFFIVIGPRSEPRQITDLEGLAKAMRKIKKLGWVTPEMAWERITALPGMDHLTIMERYGELVTRGGRFFGWHKIGLGAEWDIIFTIEGNKILFRVGHHEHVYATVRRKVRHRRY